MKISIDGVNLAQNIYSLDRCLRRNNDPDYYETGELEEAYLKLEFSEEGIKLSAGNACSGEGNFIARASIMESKKEARMVCEELDSPIDITIKLVPFRKAIQQIIRSLRHGDQIILELMPNRIKLKNDDGTIYLLMGKSCACWLPQEAENLLESESPGSLITIKTTGGNLANIAQVSRGLNLASMENRSFGLYFSVKDTGIHWMLTDGVVLFRGDIPTENPDWLYKGDGHICLSLSNFHQYVQQGFDFNSELTLVGNSRVAVITDGHLTVYIHCFEPYIFQTKVFDVVKNWDEEYSEHTFFMVERDKLLDSLKTADIARRTPRQCPRITVELNDTDHGSLKLCQGNDDIEIITPVNLIDAGIKGFIRKFNPDYLKNLLLAMNGDIIRVRVNVDNVQCRLHSPEYPHITAYIMPLAYIMPSKEDAS